MANIGMSKGMVMGRKKAPDRRSGALFLAESESNDIQVLDARREILVLGLLAVELDRQAQFVDRIRVSQRVLVADLSALVEIEQVLVEGLHAQFLGLLHDFLDLVHLALEDQVPD